MNAPVPADIRLFRVCLAASVVLNLGLLLLIGRLGRPDDPEPPQGRPRLMLVTVTVRPSPPSSVQRGVVAVRRLPAPQTATPRYVAQAAQAPTRPLDPPTRPVLPASAPPVMTAVRRTRLTAPHTSAARPPAPTLRPIVLPPLTAPAPEKPTREAAHAEAAHAEAAHAEASRGAAAGTGAELSGDTGANVGRPAGGPFGIGDGLAAAGVTRHVVYVLDVSASMSSRIERAEDELRQALDGLQPGETFNVVAFSESSQLFDPDMAEATPATRQRASTFLRTLEVGGDTNLEAAIARALMLRDVNEVVVLTDGVPTLGETDPDKLAGVIRRFNLRHARISTIGLVGRNPDGSEGTFAAAQTLRQIARDNGGSSKLVILGISEP